jgi:hypothetical protein
LIAFLFLAPILSRAGLFDITDLERYVVKRRALFVLRPWRFPIKPLKEGRGVFSHVSH